MMMYVVKVSLRISFQCYFVIIIMILTLSRISVPAVVSVVSSFMIPTTGILLPSSLSTTTTTTTTTRRCVTGVTFLRRHRQQQQEQQVVFRMMTPLLLSTTATTTMIEYSGDGEWTDEFIQEQISNVPIVQIVNQMPEPPTTKQQQQQHTNTTNNSMYTNYYYLLRHGQSTANVEEIISSDRTTLSYTMKHGLTELGYQQGTNSAIPLLSYIIQQQKENDTSQQQQRHRILFISSPFARARQTALACMNGIQDLVTVLRSSNNDSTSKNIEIVPTILLNNLLVERYFGIYDNDVLYTYGYVWPLDRKNVTHTTYNVESVAAVATRIQSCIQQIEDYISCNNNSNTIIKEEDDNSSSTTSEEEIYYNNHIVLVSHGDVLQIAQLYTANVSNVGEFSSYRFQNGEIRPMLFNDTSALPIPVPLEPPTSLVPETQK